MLRHSWSLGGVTSGSESLTGRSGLWLETWGGDPGWGLAKVRGPRFIIGGGIAMVLDIGAMFGSVFGCLAEASVAKFCHESIIRRLGIDQRA